MGRLPLGTAIAAVLVGASSRGVAQPPALEEIMVTAERHETALQKTPISIAVVHGRYDGAQGARDAPGSRDRDPELGHQSIAWQG